MCCVSRNPTIRRFIKTSASPPRRIFSNKMSHNFIAADPFCLSDAVSCEHEALAMLGAGREEFLVGNVEFATEWTGLRIETIDVVSAVTRDDWTSADVGCPLPQLPLLQELP